MNDRFKERKVIQERNKKTGNSIEKIKEQMSDDIIKTIRDDQLDYKEIALDLGISEERLVTILFYPKCSYGSELFLVSDNINKKKTLRR